jgi:hypothetical protein
VFGSLLETRFGGPFDWMAKVFKKETQVERSDVHQAQLILNHRFLERVKGLGCGRRYLKS